MENQRERAKEILKQLTLEEKIGMIHGSQLFQTKGVERLGIPSLKMSDGPMGVRQEFLPSQWKAVDLNDDYVTYLPCNSALASTWNRKQALEIGSVLGEEARGRGKDVILGPGINIKRSPLCGRNFEYFSEDPYLTGEMAAAYIKGVQLWDVAACVKHFAVNNQETQRLWVEVEIDEQSLREIYFPAFYDAIKQGGALTLMGAYNKLYGEHCCQSEFLLNQVLRKEWGFEGVIISDWGGVHDTELAANSQLDIEMSVTDNFDDYFMAQPLKKKIENGEIKEEVIDEKVLRILMLMQKLHMLDGERKSGAYNTERHRQKALEAARESIVLLKNEKQVLPLKKENLKRVLLIGENAQCLHANGGGSAEIKALYEISPLMGLKSQLGGNVEVDYTLGYCRKEDVSKKEGTQTENWQEKSLEHGGGAQKTDKENIEDNNAKIENIIAQSKESISLEEKRKELREKAVCLAKEKTYDAVIYIGGLNHEYDSEGNDRFDMKLPYEQDILIEELLKVRDDLVIVIQAGSPVEMERWIEQANTVIFYWYAGMEGGNALANVLLGKVNPSGKLPETFYKTHKDCSAHAVGEFAKEKNVAYKEGSYVGYRYNDKYQVEPRFCFGHGLSYTSFVYTEASLDFEKKQISCMIENTGAYNGSEVVQIYLRKDGSKFFQELKGFEKIFIKAGQKQQVTIALREMEKDSLYCIGSSSRDIRLSVKC